MPPMSRKVQIHRGAKAKKILNIIKEICKKNQKGKKVSQKDAESLTLVSHSLITAIDSRLDPGKL